MAKSPEALERRRKYARERQRELRKDPEYRAKVNAARRKANRERMRELRKDPEFRAKEAERMREYRKRLEVKERIRQYNALDKSKKARRTCTAKWRNTPNGKVRTAQHKKKYRQSESYKECQKRRKEDGRQQAASKKYNARPEIKERTRIRNASKQSREARANWRATPEGKEAARRGSKNYRLRKQRGRIERYTLKEIRERDRDRCYICGDKCVGGVAVGHPQQLHREHIIAVSHGGFDCKSNVSIACGKCNNKKNGSLVTRRFLVHHFSEDKQRLRLLLAMLNYVKKKNTQSIYG